MITIAPYSWEHFQALPSLDAARDRFLELGGAKFVKDDCLDLFTRYEMQRTFGLAMLHRHNDILPGQKMNKDPGAGMDEPQPAIWGYTPAGELAPTEFSYAKGHKVQLGGKEREFAAELLRKLDERGLIGVFGLCAYPGDDFEGRCEITQNSANINLKPQDFFSPPLITRGCRCTCDNRTTPHGHGTHVITQSG
ncbi:hypothetical protein PMIN01_08206 [Paraphaeosphaeria minitans]|uniref:Uncharacterized protein n=1 Tax=Paraphaeosphaeria minitans TaxID=565426 RepID=A0A9P6GEJ8_9PLEO|nr:hypothetical protein PMIN01_08206 [Paraphaeosphaeria minitans]